MSYARLFAAGVLIFAGSSGVASSQSVLSGCDPTTGLGPNGQACVELAPLDPNRISSVSLDADGSDRFRSLDVTTLGQTYDCREVDVRAGGYSPGALLIEDCGTPLTAAELGQLEPFYGTTGAPPPPTVASLPPAPVSPPPAVASLPTAPVSPPPTVASLPAAPPPSPPTLAPTPPSVPAISVPAPSSLPPVNQIASATLAGDTATGFVPLAAAAAPFIAGAAGVAGVAAAAAAAGGSSASSTN